MDEIGQEDELIAQFAGVASVPASEVHDLPSRPFVSQPGTFSGTFSRTS